MNKHERELFESYKKGMHDAMMMKENADGCTGCAFEETESWQPPCTMCKRNCKDYWRAKKVLI